MNPNSFRLLAKMGKRKDYRALIPLLILIALLLAILAWPVFFPESAPTWLYKPTPTPFPF